MSQKNLSEATMDVIETVIGMKTDIVNLATALEQSEKRIEELKRVADDALRRADESEKRERELAVASGATSKGYVTEVCDVDEDDDKEVGEYAD